MKFELTDPCAQCPFRREAAPGWLGGYTPSLIVNQIRDGTTWFPCHMTVDYSKEDWRLGLLDEDSKAQHCAGFLILMKKMGYMPKDKFRTAQFFRVNSKADVFESGDDFINHHSVPPWEKNQTPEEG